MALQRKLNRETSHRTAMLKNLVTSFFLAGRIETTEARAKEVKNLAEKLISSAVRELDNFTLRQVKVSSAKLDANGKKVTKTVTSKNGNKYEVVEREIRMQEGTVDSPTRLHARRQMFKWVNLLKDSDGKRINVVDKVFNEIAPMYKTRAGGYTRIYKLGPRKGDAAEMAILELV